MMNTSMIFGSADVHLLGKILDAVSDEFLEAEGFSKREIARAEGIFQDLDKHLNRVIRLDWNDREVA
jgi:hypothetical protein